MEARAASWQTGLLHCPSAALVPPTSNAETYPQNWSWPLKLSEVLGANGRISFPYGLLPELAPFSHGKSAVFFRVCTFSHPVSAQEGLAHRELAWDHLKQSSLAFISGEIKLPKGYCDADLTLDSKLEVLLPRRQGLGLCSTALASYLISLHNDFVHSVNKHTREDDG